MEVFVSVVELGSFTAAANAHRISPAMVSKHIHALEARLGATLLTRTTRRHHLTEIGRNYFESCKQVLNAVAAAETGAEVMRGKPQGLLRVSASVWYGALTLAPLICDYLKHYPEVDIELSLSDRFVDIIEEGFDIAIRIGELEDSSLIARKLSTFEWAICAAPEYLAHAGMPRKPDDLLHHQCLGFTNWRSQSGWKLVEKQLAKKAGDVSRFDSNNGQALRAAALKGIGIIMMPKVLLQDDLEKGTLVEVLQEYAPPARPVNAVYPRERQAAPKLASFVDFLINNLSGRAMS